MNNKVLTLSSRLYFGKHKGCSIQYVIDNDPTYMPWALRTINWLKVDSITESVINKINVPLRFYSSYPRTRYRDYGGNTVYHDTNYDDYDMACTSPF